MLNRMPIKKGWPHNTGDHEKQAHWLQKSYASAGTESKKGRMACRHRTEHRNLMGQQSEGPNENLSFCSGVRLLYDTRISQNFKEFEIIIIKLVEKLKIVTSLEMDESFLS